MLDLLCREPARLLVGIAQLGNRVAKRLCATVESHPQKRRERDVTLSPLPRLPPADEPSKVLQEFRTVIVQVGESVPRRDKKLNRLTQEVPVIYWPRVGPLEPADSRACFTAAVTSWLNLSTRPIVAVR